MNDVVILGAGKIGRTVAQMLARTGDYRLRIGDTNEKSLLETAEGLPNTTTLRTDFASDTDIDRILTGAKAVVSCAPFFCNVKIAGRARTKKVHYFDLTEDVAVTKSVMQLAEGADCALMPQCGLAPGFITIAAMYLMAGLTDVRELKLRVGALPKRPSSIVHYNLTWSTNGLINEYCNPCEALHDGQPISYAPLEGLEQLTVEGVRYEAFNTSGGLGTLTQSLRGKVQELTYKTVRFPGHQYLLRFLFHDLRFQYHRDELQKILERALPYTLDDQVVIYACAVGNENGRLTERTYAQTIPDQEICGQRFGAIQITTAAGVCAVLDLMMQGKLPTRGFVRQEQVVPAEFFANRFGAYYRSR